MKIGELDQHCGECSLIELCGEPYSDIMLCANEVLANIEERDYIDTAEAIREKSKRNWSNKTIEKMICRLAASKK